MNIDRNESFVFFPPPQNKTKAQLSTAAKNFRIKAIRTSGNLCARKVDSHRDEIKQPLKKNGSSLTHDYCYPWSRSRAAASAALDRRSSAAPHAAAAVAVPPAACPPDSVVDSAAAAAAAASVAAAAAAAAGAGDDMADC